MSTNGNGSVRWLMGILAVLITAATIGWVSHAEGRMEKLYEVREEVSLLKQRLDAIEKVQRETNDNVKLLLASQRHEVGRN